MNLNSGFQEAPILFNLVTCVSVVGSLLFFVAFVGSMWWKGMLVL
jgi:hypothetical protein